jgi:O-methyltransferase domain/Dimerisation domain
MTTRERDKETRAARQKLLDMATGFFRGKVLCAAVRLGVADALANGATALDELAATTEANPDGLRRLLRALASMGFVEEVAPNRFALTPFGDLLRRDAPNSAWASIVFWADLLADAWTYLPDCVKAGDNSGAASAREREGVKSRWSLESDAPAIFHRVFAEGNAADFAPYSASYDFSRFGVIADLGGGGGGLLSAILAAQPAARGVLVEREGAIDGCAARLEATGLAARCALVAADLLQSVPPGADAYVMRCVLHGYDDESALRLLRNARDAMSPEARLLVIEVVLPDLVDRADPAVEKLLMSDLNMLAVTGGRERSATEWRALVTAADLELCGIVPVAGEMHSIIEAGRRAS